MPGPVDNKAYDIHQRNTTQEGNASRQTRSDVQRLFVDKPGGHGQYNLRQGHHQKLDDLPRGGDWEDPFITRYISNIYDVEIQAEELVARVGLQEAPNQADLLKAQMLVGKNNNAVTGVQNLVSEKNKRNREIEQSYTA